MPVENESESSPVPGLTAVKFQKSVPMVTYLACFIVCDFEYEEKLTSIHNTKFRVYATPEQSTRVKYALDIGANITDFFTDYYDNMTSLTLSPSKTGSPSLTLFQEQWSTGGSSLTGNSNMDPVHSFVSPITSVPTKKVGPPLSQSISAPF